MSAYTVAAVPDGYAACRVLRDGSLLPETVFPSRDLAAREVATLRQREELQRLRAQYRQVFKPDPVFRRPVRWFEPDAFA